LEVDVLGKSIRYRRLFGAGPRGPIVVPLDHSLSMGVVPGMEDLARLVRLVANNGANAVVLHKGQIESLLSRHGAAIFDSLCVIAHLTGSTSMSPNPTRQVIVATADDAVELGADWVSLQVNFGTRGEPEMLENFGAVTTAARQRGLPVLAMAYVRDDNGNVCLDPERVTHAARVAEELGASAVKVPMVAPESVARMCKVVSIPILLAGGKKGRLPEFTGQLEGGLRAGAAGFCVGRNVFQADDPAEAMSCLRALMQRTEKRPKTPGARKVRHEHEQTI
jgi:DhnA family fructose-bisphosphate aldolase class Ia